MWVDEPLDDIIVATPLFIQSTAPRSIEAISSKTTTARIEMQPDEAESDEFGDLADDSQAEAQLDVLYDTANKATPLGKSPPLPVCESRSESESDDDYKMDASKDESKASSPDSDVPVTPKTPKLTKTKTPKSSIKKVIKYKASRLPPRASAKKGSVERESPPSRRSGGRSRVKVDYEEDLLDGEIAQGSEFEG